MPVLVPSPILDALHLNLKHRSDAKVLAQNLHVFDLYSRTIDLLACNLMRKFSERCGTEKPQTLRGTELRKQMATKCITLNLSENQVSDLTNFMRHHEKIHKEIYRQPVIQNDIIKISQLLKIAQGKKMIKQPVNEDSSSE